MQTTRKRLNGSASSSTPQRQPTVSSSQSVPHTRIGDGRGVGRPAPGTGPRGVRQHTHTRDSAGHNEEQEACVSRGGGWQRLFLWFCVFFCFCVFQVFYAKTTTLCFYNQEETHLYKKEKTAKRHITVENARGTRKRHTVSAGDIGSSHTARTKKGASRRGDGHRTQTGRLRDTDWTLSRRPPQLQDGGLTEDTLVWAETRRCRLAPPASARAAVLEAVAETRTSSPHFYSVRVPQSHPQTLGVSPVRRSPGCVNQEARLRTGSPGAGPARRRGGEGASPGTRGTVLRQCQVKGQVQGQWTTRSCSYPGQYPQGRGLGGSQGKAGSILDRWEPCSSDHKGRLLSRERPPEHMWQHAHPALGAWVVGP